MAQATSSPELKPYWWEAAPRPDLPEVDLPAEIDVCIVGSGYTGLSAALTLARAGCGVLVVDREAAGWGASSRNQGHIGASFKRGITQLTKALGISTANRIYAEGIAAVEACKALAREESPDCRLLESGRFIAACSRRHYESLAREIEQRKERTGLEADMVPRAELSQHIGSDRYQGGALLHREAGLHGALFHRGLLERARSIGVVVSAFTEAKAIENRTNGFLVKTSKGNVHARDVIVATNGYTGAVKSWLQRRVVPINSFGIATEELDASILSRLLPGRRPCIDTLRLSHGFRPSPGENRLIFGTRPAVGRADLVHAAQYLRRQMSTVFPELTDTRITHAWTGFTGFPFEMLPHVGVHEGVHYSLGYCGYGVALAPYLGRKVAHRVLGEPEGETVFAELDFPTRPLYFGKPWFLSCLLLGYRWQDLRTR